MGFAYKEIEKAAGQQFDPEIVRTFLTMPQMIWEDLAAPINSGQFIATGQNVWASDLDSLSETRVALDILFRFQKFSARLTYCSAT